MEKEKWFVKLKNVRQTHVHLVDDIYDLRRKIEGKKFGLTDISFSSSIAKKQRWIIWSNKKYAGFCIHLTPKEIG